MTERRFDPLRGHSTWVAPGRAGRPHDFDAGRDAEASRRACPFCEGQEERTTPETAALRPRGGVENGPDWTVRVVTNLYPALVPDAPAPTVDGADRRFATAGAGRHEVLIETTDHDAHPAEYDLDHATAMLGVLRDRVAALAEDPAIGYVIAFQNFGARSGASLRHPHQQIVGLPDAPAWVARTDHDAVREQLDEASGTGRRVVAGDDRLVALVPFAPRFIGELHVVPLGDAPDFRDLDDAWLRALAERRRDALARMRIAFGDPDYNLILHAHDATRHRSAASPWRLEVLPRLTTIGGFELATGGYIASMSPEQAADRLRGANGSIEDQNTST